MNKTALRQLARDCVTEHGDEAWDIYRAVAFAGIAPDDNWPRSKYSAKCVKIFEAERFDLNTDPNTYKPGKREAADMRELMGIPMDHPLPVVRNATRAAVLTIKPDAKITQTKNGICISPTASNLKR
jgi:hypothetical protein